MKSSFFSDLKKEKRLSVFLDMCYARHLKQYRYKRIINKEDQIKGVDVVFQHKTRGCSYYVDEKSQLDYINERLPTFAFELFYQKNGTLKKGWLFDSKKKTDFYALITSIFTDDKKEYTSCDITFVNRKKLLGFIEEKVLSEEEMEKLVKPHFGFHGKMHLSALDPKFEGYIYFSGKNKSEKPINLVFYLDFLHRINVAKRLI